ncbi:MAG: AtpZ/AtpI family protein [Chloroflexi bacterium]|nr:AtpZ/AtpI family protein [Chloroflexota bacterium]
MCDSFPKLFVVKQSRGAERYAVAVRLLGLGWFVSTSIAGGVLAGVWLDGRIGRGVPVFTLFGLGLGLTVAFYGTYRMVAPLLSGPKKKRKG